MQLVGSVPISPTKIDTERKKNARPDVSNRTNMNSSTRTCQPSACLHVPIIVWDNQNE